MLWLNKVFYDTTNPNSSYQRILYVDVLVSVFLHACIYTLVFTACLFFFKFPVKWNVVYIFMVLIVTMIIGYFARLCRVKCLAKTLGSDENAMNQLRPAYFVWYFLG
jgi:hypothetical protein